MSVSFSGFIGVDLGFRISGFRLRAWVSLRRPSLLRAMLTNVAERLETSMANADDDAGGGGGGEDDEVVEDDDILMMATMVFKRTNPDSTSTGGLRRRPFQGCCCFEISLLSYLLWTLPFFAYIGAPPDNGECILRCILGYTSTTSIETYAPYFRVLGPIIRTVKGTGAWSPRILVPRFVLNKEARHRKQQTIRI